MSFVARMRKEHADLAEKLNKLHTFRGTAEFSALTPEEQHLLVIQASAMGQYLYVLAARIELSGEPIQEPAEPELGEPVQVGDADIDRNGPPKFDI